MGSGSRVFPKVAYRRALLFTLYPLGRGGIFGVLLWHEVFYMFTWEEQEVVWGSFGIGIGFSVAFLYLFA